MEREEAERLVRLHGQAVFRLAYARTGSREDAEDVTQETFLRLVRTGPEFQDEEHCRAWLFRVAANCAGDLFRSAWRRRSRPLEEAEHVAAPGEDEEAGEVLRAVLSLPEHYRVPVHLFYYEGTSIAQVAQVLKMREGTVRTRLVRARAMLREQLKGGEERA